VFLVSQNPTLFVKPLQIHTDQSDLKCIVVCNFR